MGGTTFLDTSRNGTFQALRFNGLLTSGGTTVVDASQNGTFANIAMSGNFTGTHGQNIGTTDFPILNGTFYRQSAATSGFAWSIGSTVTNVLDFRDSGSSARMTLNATGAAGFGIYLGAPTIYAQATNAVSYALKAIGYPSGTADIFIAESAGGTNYFTVGYSGNLSGTHIQNIGTGDSITVAGCTGCGSGGVTSVSGTSPVVSSGGTTPAISCSTCVTTAGGQSIAGTTTFNTGIFDHASASSPASYGFSGESTHATSGSGVVGIANGGSSTSLFLNGGNFQSTYGVGVFASGGLWAGYFSGPVNVTGALTVSSCSGCGVTSVSGTSPGVLLV